MRRRILQAVCIALICATAALAQDDLYSQIKPLETAVASGSATREQQLELARLYIQAGRYYEASKVANRVLESNRDDAEATAIRSQALAGLREAGSRAIAEAEAKARAEGATEQDRLALANAYFDAGRYGEAAEAYAKLPEGMRDRELRLRHARSLAWSRQMDEAEAMYAAILAEESTPDIELEYGRLLSWMGASNAAVQRLDRAYGTTRSEEAVVALANARAWSGNRDEAIRLLTSYTNENPNAAEARTLLGQLRTSPDVRLERIDKLIALEPYNLALRVQRARILYDAGRYGESLKTIRFVREHSRETVADVDDLERQARLRRDEERARLGERRAALDSRNPQNAEQILELAQAYTAVEAYDEAARLYQDYLSIVPDDDRARLQYARVLSWDRRFGASQREYERLLAENPDRADVRLEYAQVMSYDSDFVGAIRTFRSLTDLSNSPRSYLYTEVPSRAHFNLGQIYRWYGWNEHAVREQNMALSLDAGYVPARTELTLARYGRPTSTLDARYSYATDSNDFTLRRVDLTRERWLNSRLAVQGAIGRHNFSHFDDSIDANVGSAGLAYRASDRWLYRGRVGATFYEEGLGTRPFFGLGAEWLPNIQSRAAFDFNHYDLIYDVFALSALGQPDAAPTINFNDPISINDFRAHYDWNSGGFWSFLGDTSYGFISDDNKRASAHGVLALRLWRQPFIAVKADARWLSYDFRTPRYWSPDDYNSLAGVLQVGQNIRDRFFWSAEAKLGKSWEGERESDLRSYSARVTIPVGDTFDIIGNYGYGKSGRFDSLTGSDDLDFTNYWQRHWYVGIRLKRLYSGDDRRDVDPYYYDNRILTGSPVATPVGEPR